MKALQLTLMAMIAITLAIVSYALLTQTVDVKVEAPIEECNSLPPYRWENGRLVKDCR